MTLARYGAFAVTALVVLLIPGPAVLYVAGRGIDQGRRAGVLSGLGLGVGNLVQVAAAVAGLSAIIAASAVAFSAVKYAGAAYLIYLGIRRWRAGDLVFDLDRAPDPVPLRRVFLEGVVVNVLNPKTALFFLTFLPQFVDPAAGGVTAQLALLGVTFAALGVVTDSGYGLLGARLGPWLRSRRSARRWQRHVAAGTYVGLGVLAATSKA